MTPSELHGLKAMIEKFESGRNWTYYYHDNVRWR